MSADELDARLKEIEEHAQACMTLAVLSSTELVWLFSSLLIKRGLCTPQHLIDQLDLASEDVKPSENDSPETKLGKDILAQSIGLLRRRLELHIADPTSAPLQ